MLLSVDQSDTPAANSVSFDIIAAVAEQEGVDPIDIEPPEYEALYNAINPEALDALFAPRENGSSRSNGRVEFTFSGYQIVVTGDGEVEAFDQTDTR
ncbi:hypothetical protein GS429_19880 [Natronorubrum sp. JWXQ-INN-674]|uniref:Halobacterial output domain-containing protein n=1 Tax=Natronorubrum halalkaliphilum TaxID=2691917 RepID=A0A6B0VS54_9EURY|nr:HalOD1 output domain-containing protein [Natronorubrum halalkaliphilum]MXV64284.1 hypothetical protein [Natronorubrum halalkaliphilum]